MKIAGVNWNIEATKKLTWKEFEKLYKGVDYLKRVDLQKLYDRIQGCKGEQPVKKAVKQPAKNKK